MNSPTRTVTHPASTGVADAGPYDALLLVSFGGPEGPDDVIPFLERVTAGRDVPAERLEEVAEHYRAFGGRSPINEQNRELASRLQTLLAENGPDLPVYLGNRNWHPFLQETLQDMATAGISHALCLVTSAYASYSGCRQYREDLAAARVAVGPAAPTLDKIRVFSNHPGFIDAQVESVRSALASLDDTTRATARIVFTTHSIPLTMARHCDYEAQHLDACHLVMEHFPGHRWELVFNSRSGPAHVPWLGPDVNEHLRAVADDGASGVVLVPIGFLTDHLEVVHDLDVEARATAAELHLPMARAATVGPDPHFLSMLRELILERTAGAPRRALGTRGASHDACPVDCCRTPGQEVRPTVASAPPPPPR